METDNVYPEIYNFSNLIVAWRKARKGKTKKNYVIEFEKNLRANLLKLHEELKNQTYSPRPLKTFILRDPKTRKISKSDFRDRIVHHAIINLFEPIFEKIFFYDSCANRIGKGNLFALKRFELFKRKVTNNLKSEAFCFKADIKHYFQEVNHKTLIEIIKRKMKDEKVIWLIERILENLPARQMRSGDASFTGNLRPDFRNNIKNIAKLNRSGMPLGNLTSQFFANVYLNELDYFVKNVLRVKYYIRYVDDFVILHSSKSQLENWKKEIIDFLSWGLKLELHPEKSKIISLSKGIDFVGFRNYWYYRLLRKRNIRKMIAKTEDYKKENITKEKILEIFQGWNAYAEWADSYGLRKKILEEIY